MKAVEIKADAENPESLRYCVTVGTSMLPTLQGRELLELRPLSGRPHLGDIVLYRPPAGANLVVHRVVASTEQGVATRGDNSVQNDPWLLQPSDIVGKVVAVWRGQRQIRIRGGALGFLLARTICLARRAAFRLWRFVKPLHRLVCRSGILRSLAPRGWRQRVIAISIDGESAYRLLLGNREVGHYDTATGRWRIPAQWRLFVDESKLPPVADTERRG